MTNVAGHSSPATEPIGCWAPVMWLQRALRSVPAISGTSPDAAEATVGGSRSRSELESSQEAAPAATWAATRPHAPSPRPNSAGGRACHGAAAKHLHPRAPSTCHSHRHHPPEQTRADSSHPSRQGSQPRRARPSKSAAWERSAGLHIRVAAAPTQRPRAGRARDGEELGVRKGVVQACTGGSEGDSDQARLGSG